MKIQHHVPDTLVAVIEKTTIILVAILPGVVLVLALVSSAQEAGADPLTLDESDLNADGLAYELNIDQDGRLWISDYSANEIRQLNPATNVYTAYLGLEGPSDARRDSAGNVWWTDFDNNRLGRIGADTLTATTWSLTGSGVAWGTAFDDAGRLWMSDFFDSLIFRFNPADSELCSYTIPGEGSSEYIVASEDEIWLGDRTNERIIRFEPAAGRFTFWQLHSGAYPRGLLATDSGELWWADSALGFLAVLDPDISQMTSYALPQGTEPAMISRSGGKIWYSEIGDSSFGSLDPQLAASTSTIVSKSVETTSAPGCTSLVPESVEPVTVETGVVSWSTMTYTVDTNNEGWMVYEMPPGSSPWGVAAGASNVWVVDNGRAKLVWLGTTSSLYLPVVVK